MWQQNAKKHGKTRPKNMVKLDQKTGWKNRKEKMCIFKLSLYCTAEIIE